MDGVPRNTHIGGSGSAGGLPPNNRNNGSQPPVLHARSGTPAPFPAIVGIIHNRHGILERGILIRNSAGQFESYAVRNPELLSRLNLNAPVRLMHVGERQALNIALPTVHAATQQRLTYLIPLTRVPTVPPHNPQVTAQQRQYNAASLGGLLPDMVHELGQHLTPGELDRLSRVSRHLYHATRLRRQGLTNAMWLARGAGAVLNGGHVVRRNRPGMDPAQFDSALQYIQNLPPNHQRQPLQELVRHATTQEQFGAVFDYLRNQGRLPHIPLPANFAALSPEAQRAVEIFSWRQSGQVRATQQERRNILNGYADLLQGIEGTAFPQPYIDLARALGTIPALLRAFSAPEGLDVDTGIAWLNREAQRGNLRLTTEIYYLLPNNFQVSIQDTLPTYTTYMRQSNNYVNGTWPLHPAL